MRDRSPLFNAVCAVAVALLWLVVGADVVRRRIGGR